METKRDAVERLRGKINHASSEVALDAIVGGMFYLANEIDAGAKRLDLIEETLRRVPPPEEPEPYTAGERLKVSMAVANSNVVRDRLDKMAETIGRIQHEASARKLFDEVAGDLAITRLSITRYLQQIERRIEAIEREGGRMKAEG